MFTASESMDIARWTGSDRPTSGGGWVVLTALARLIEERLAELGISARAAERRAEAAGHKVSHATISSIKNGKHSGRIEDDTLVALSHALGLPVERIARAAGQRHQPLTEYELPAKAKKLTPEMWQLVVDQIDAVFALQERIQQQRQPDEA